MSPCRHVECFGEEAAHARGVQNARHAYDAVLGEAGALEGHLAHRIERVRDDDENGVGRILDHFVNDRRDDAGVRLQEVVAAHAGLAREARSDDDHVGVRRRRVVVGRADEPRVEAFDGRGLRQVERLALRHALDDVNQHDVAQLLAREPVRGGRADVARADHCNLVSLAHRFYSSFLSDRCLIA